MYICKCCGKPFKTIYNKENKKAHCFSQKDIRWLECEKCNAVIIPKSEDSHNWFFDAKHKIEKDYIRKPSIKHKIEKDYIRKLSIKELIKIIINDKIISRIYNNRQYK